MNTLNLFTGGLLKGCRVYVDGKQIKLNRASDGAYKGVFNTDSAEAEIAIVKMSELYGTFWFLWAILFFIISGFGIFNSRYDKKCTTVNCRAVVKLNGVTNLRFEFNKFAEGQSAVSFWCDGQVDVKEDVFGIDGQAKKRFKILTLAEVFLWLALIAIIIAVIITKII